MSYRSSNNGNHHAKLLCLAVLSLSVVSAVWVVGFKIYRKVIFNIECSGHLKRASDANTPEKARPELDKAITFLEARRLTTGYTSILYQTPNEDIGFWYTNLVDARKELDRIIHNRESTQLEESNVLMKLRETLIDHGETLRVTAPPGISVYPQNTSLLLQFVISFAIGILAFIGMTHFTGNGGRYRGSKPRITLIEVLIVGCTIFIIAAIAIAGAAG